MVDGLESKSKTVYQFNGCKWHGCACQGDQRTPAELDRYQKNLGLEQLAKLAGYTVVSVWECENPPMKDINPTMEFRPYPYFIAADFEAILKPLKESRTDDLTYNNLHIPVSFSINDNLTNQPNFYEFIKDIKVRHETVAKKMLEMYPMINPTSLRKQVFEQWTQWIDQVLVIFFNGGNYDINMIKKHFVKHLSNMND